MRTKKPVRIDPLTLIKKTNSRSKARSKTRSKTRSKSKSKTRSKHQSRQHSRKNSRKRSKKHSKKNSRRRSRRRSRKNSRNKKHSRRRSKKKSRQKEINLYQPINLNQRRRNLVPESKTGSRVSSNRAVYQRLSPYFLKKEVGPKTPIKQLEILDKSTKSQPMLNQIINESILIRSRY